jgi:molecular chaperone GrpE
VTKDGHEAEPRHRDVEEAAAEEAAASVTDEGDADPTIDPDIEPETESRTGQDDEDDIEALRTEATQYREHLQRLQAEFDNYRKRVLREQTTAVEQAARPVFRRLLEVLDDFDLALMHAQDRPDFDRFLHGVELVYAKLLETLRAEGLEQMDAQGKPFDPENHEALMQTGAGEGDPVVADVLRPGYTLKGRVLRPAGVRVERK